MCNSWCIEFSKKVVPLSHQGMKILEVGSRDVNGSSRNLFDRFNPEYVGIDICKGPGVDVVMDVKELKVKFSHEYFDVVISTEMIEHCYEWQDAIFNMLTVLKPGGILILTTRSPGFPLHEYPHDFWRFTRKNFLDIFKSVGKILEIEDDKTLGWPCGIGVIIQKEISNQELQQWLLDANNYLLFSMDQERIEQHDRLLNPSELLMFDQYSRYKACVDLLRSVGLSPGDSILDVGSGPECWLGHFLPDADISYVDPLISPNSNLKAIRGDVFSGELDNRQYEYIVAIDVFEHIPTELRSNFIERINSMAKKFIILAFPTSDTEVAADVDQTIDQKYQEIFKNKYPWLAEHDQYGLPSAKNTINMLESLGWHCKTIGHGHAPWLKELLGSLICIWDIPEMREFCLQISEEFNKTLYQYDFQKPHYREFIMASRAPLANKINLGEGDNSHHANELYDNLIKRFNKEYLSSSLAGFLKKRKEILELNEMMRSKVLERDNQILELNGMMRSKVLERDNQILELNKMLMSLNLKAEEVSLWAKSLQDSLIQKDAEAVKITDWAQELLVLLEKRNTTIVSKIKSKILSFHKKVKNFFYLNIRIKILERIKYCVRRYQHHINIAAVKTSIQKNNGRLIIGFPIITWEFRWQRPQHILSGLRDSGFSILYLAISLLPINKRLEGELEAGSKVGFNRLDKHIHQIWLNSSNSLNIYTDIIDGDDLHNTVMGLSYVIDLVKPTSLIYMVQFPGWGPVAMSLKKRFGGKIIFDCMDDHAGFDTATDDVLKVENDLIKAADLVVTPSELLYRKVSKQTGNLIQIKNATEFKHFNNPVRNGLLDHLSSAPIVGYYGAISSWFDAELISFCAINRPEINFVLIGSTFGAELECIKGLSNVHLIGEISYSKLPGYLAYFDVCIIPFKLLPLTLATNPVKFYEYLSAGKPVVSVNLPELIPYSMYCYLATNPADFLAQIDSALIQKEDDQLISRRIQLAKDNSWNMRVAQLLNHELLK